MHFLITGGAGFIGSHLTEQLLAAGHRVTVVDNLTTGHCKNLPSHPALTLLNEDISLCQPDDFTDPIQGLVHLAATASVSHSWDRPLEVHHNNLSTTMAVIQLCHALKIPRLVFASSAAVYGNPIQLPLDETQPPNPISPYGLHKLFGEQYVSLFTKHYGFSAVLLRLFNVFGERQVLSSSYSGVISAFISAMQQGLPITLYGDGTQTRDFIYVKDVAIAMEQALIIPLANRTCITCNIGTGKPTSLLQLLEILKPYFPHQQTEIKFAPRRSGDIQHSWTKIDNASDSLGFVPQWSVNDGLSHYVESLLNQGVGSC